MDLPDIPLPRWWTPSMTYTALVLGLVVFGALVGA